MDAAPATKPAIEGFRHGRVPRAVREQQILDVAEQVFIEFGFHGASIEEITRRAGVARPLIYTYFGGKDALYLACCKRARAHIDERLGAVSATVDHDAPDALRQALEAGGRAYFQFLADMPAHWDMLYSSGAAAPGPIAEEITRMRFASIDVIAALSRAYLPADVDDRTIAGFAQAIAGAGEQLARWSRHTPGIGVDDLTDVFTRMAWSGLSHLVAKDRS